MYQVFEFGKIHAIGFADVLDHGPSGWIIEKHDKVARDLRLRFDHANTHLSRLALTRNFNRPNPVDEINFFTADQVTSRLRLQCEQPLEYLGARRKGEWTGN